MKALINREPLAEIVYVSIADIQTLKEFETQMQKPALVSMAVKFGKTRLIDNIILE